MAVKMEREILSACTLISLPLLL